MSIKTNKKFEEFVKYLQLPEQAEKNTKNPTLLPEYREFMEKFPISKLDTLTLDEYCVGKGEKSFCWWFERGLEKTIGRYSPGSSRGHLIYFDAKTGKIQKVEKLQKFDDDTALKNILKIHSLIARADPNDLDWIDDDQEISKRTGLEDLTIGAARKLRVLSIYHTNDIIPIASSEHCEHFLRELGSDPSEIPAYQKPIARMLLLREYFNEIKKKVPELTSASFVWQLYDASSPLMKPVKTQSAKYDITNSEELMINNSSTRNIILYGPPGTGKTFITANKAVEICTGQTFSNGKREELMQIYSKLVAEKRISFVTFHQSYGYEEFIEGLRPLIRNAENPTSSPSSNVQYEIRPGVFKKICDEAEKSNQNFVIIIDEINRGNMSKIFGELITLIEDDKRKAISVTLPYSHQTFFVPKNLYIIGTMNTADRSLANVDTALRRRFHFLPMMPDASVLEELNDTPIKKIKIGEMLRIINKRIEALYDREHTIGHAYFTKLLSNKVEGKPYEEEEKFKDLQQIFKNKVIPLLEEYFFDDWAKIRLVLGDNQKRNKAHQFIHELNEMDGWEDLFGKTEDIQDVAELKRSYAINLEAFKDPNSYIEIYSKV